MSDNKTFGSISSHRFILIVTTGAVLISFIVIPSSEKSVFITVLAIALAFGLRTLIDIRAKSVEIVLSDDRMVIRFRNGETVTIIKRHIQKITPFKALKNPWSEGGLLIKTREGSHKIFRDYLSDYEELKNTLRNSGWGLE